MKTLSHAHQYSSPNRGGVLRDPRFIVIHFTAGRSLAGSTQWLCSPAAKASAHLIIGRDGGINQLVPFDTIAWHAGESRWKGLTGLNRFSLGIELDAEGPLVKGGDGLFRSPITGIVVPPKNVAEAKHKNGGAWQYWSVYPSGQLRVLEDVCRELVAAFPSITECVGHDDICVPIGRKSDPGPCLDIESLNSVVFGRA